MIEEEKLAEEYRKSLWQRLTDEDNFERLEMFDENVEEAFLAGLEAGRPKWHKVAGGDLPKDDDFVCNQDGMPCWFDIETDQWLDCEGTQIRTTEWCEMPKF